MMPDHTVQLAHTSFILISRNVQIEAKRSQEDALHGVDALDGHGPLARQDPAPRNGEVHVAQRRIIMNLLGHHN